jgi:hypothetical protein
MSHNPVDIFNSGNSTESAEVVSDDKNGNNENNENNNGNDNNVSNDNNDKDNDNNSNDVDNDDTKVTEFGQDGGNQIYDIFNGAYSPTIIDSVLPTIPRGRNDSDDDTRSKPFTHTVYRHTMDDEKWNKDVDENASTQLSLLSVLHNKLAIYPYSWCSTKDDIETVLSVLKSSPNDVLLLTRDGKKKDYIPSIRDDTRTALQFLCNDHSIGNEMDTILSYSKYKYWEDIPMSECRYIPVSSHLRTIPSIYGAVAKSLYLWNDKERNVPDEDTLRNTAVTLRRNVMNYVFHNLYTCYMDGICFDDLLSQEYDTHSSIVESFYKAIAGGAKFYNPCSDVFSDDWIRGHWGEWDNSLKYLTYIAQSNAISNPSEPQSPSVSAHPGNTTDIFFLAQYANRVIVLCNIQNSLTNTYHPFRVALPVSRTAHHTVPIFLYTESNGHYGLLWLNHFGNPRGSVSQPPASMILNTSSLNQYGSGTSYKKREGLFSKRRNDWIVFRDPFSVTEFVNTMDTDLEYQPPTALFITRAKERIETSEKSATPETNKETSEEEQRKRRKGLHELTDFASIPQTECVRLGSYSYPVNIPNIDILKEYINSNVSVDNYQIDNMPVDIKHLMTGGEVTFINMGSKNGQNKYRQAKDNKWIFASN